MLVAAFLIREGWMVFRNVAPVGDVDLIAKKDQTILEIDVTTGFRNTKGQIQHGKKGCKKQVAVIVTGEERPIFIPPLSLIAP